MHPKLRLTVRDLRSIQQDHGISNILKPSADDGDRMQTLDFLVDVISRGTAHLGDARPDVEEMTLEELVETFKAWNSPVGEADSDELGNGD